MVSCRPKSGGKGEGKGRRLRLEFARRFSNLGPHQPTGNLDRKGEVGKNGGGGCQRPRN